VDQPAHGATLARGNATRLWARTGTDDEFPLEQLTPCAGPLSPCTGPGAGFSPTPGRDPPLARTGKNSRWDNVLGFRRPDDE